MYVLKAKYKIEHKGFITLSSTTKPKIGDTVIFNKNGMKRIVNVVDVFKSESPQKYEVLYIGSNKKNKIHEFVGRAILNEDIVISNHVFEKCKAEAARKGKSEISFNQFKRRIARDVIIAKKHHETGLNNTIRFEYGSLHIYVNILLNQVVDVMTVDRRPVGWRKDKDIHMQLNKEFGIIGK